jgi:hypothetical protein
METSISCETSVNIYQTTWGHIPKTVIFTVTAVLIKGYTSTPLYAFMVW